jgi:hypothetical protein
LASSNETAFIEKALDGDAVLIMADKWREAIQEAGMGDITDVKLRVGSMFISLDESPSARTPAEKYANGAVSDLFPPSSSGNLPSESVTHEFRAYRSA